MAVEPSENAIQSFMGLSGLPRSNAIRWLKVSCSRGLRFQPSLTSLAPQASNNDANNAAISWIDGGQADLPPPPRVSPFLHPVLGWAMLKKSEEAGYIFGAALARRPRWKHAPESAASL